MSQVQQYVHIRRFDGVRYNRKKSEAWCYNFFFFPFVHMNNRSFVFCMMFYSVKVLHHKYLISK